MGWVAGGGGRRVAWRGDGERWRRSATRAAIARACIWLPPTPHLKVCRAELGRHALGLARGDDDLGRVGRARGDRDENEGEEEGKGGRAPSPGRHPCCCLGAGCVRAQWRALYAVAVVVVGAVVVVPHSRMAERKEERETRGPQPLVLLFSRVCAKGLMGAL